MTFPRCQVVNASRQCTIILAVIPQTEGWLEKPIQEKISRGIYGVHAVFSFLFIAAPPRHDRLTICILEIIPVLHTSADCPEDLIISIPSAESLDNKKCRMARKTQPAIDWLTLVHPLFNANIFYVPPTSSSMERKKIRKHAFSNIYGNLNAHLWTSAINGLTNQQING